MCIVREGCAASEAGLPVGHYLITGIDKSRETAGDAFFTRLKLPWEATKPSGGAIVFSKLQSVVLFISI